MRMQRHSAAAIVTILLYLVAGHGTAVSAPAAQPGQSAADRNGEPAVLRVGSFNGVSGNFERIQAAVDAAEPGDWVLIGPGVYHPSAKGGRAGVFVDKPDIHIRGMDRNRVIVDGSLPGAGVACPSDPEFQDFGPKGENGEYLGRVGIWVLRASGVSVENLSACNFLTGSSRYSGNQIYWDGNSDDLDFFMGSWHGAYLSTTATFYEDGADPIRGEYGIFIQRSNGPGRLEHAYASNMADAGFYIGGCPDCNAVVDDIQAENNAAGYSGTNAGGRLIVQNSEWNDNKAGLIPNSLNVDPPPPQDGACPAGEVGPTGTDSCTVFRNNFVHHNNNPNVPQAPGVSAGIPVGVGFLVAGGRNNTLTDNRIENNGGWGVLLTVFPDQRDQSPPGANCQGGISLPGGVCYFNDFGNEISHNVFLGNGFFDNPTNGDIAEISDLNDPGNCWRFNRSEDGRVKSWPPLLQTTNGVCDIPNSGVPVASLLGLQANCAGGALAECPNLPLANYPRQEQVELIALEPQPTMPDPCEGVPANPWCQGRVPEPTLPEGNITEAAVFPVTNDDGTLPMLPLPLSPPAQSEPGLF